MKYEKYFNNLQIVIENVLATLDINKNNLWDDPGKRKYLFLKDVKFSQRIINHSKRALSMIACCSASGVLLPPYIIYYGKSMWVVLKLRK